MADMHMTGPARGEESSGNIASAANWLGAAMSLALIVGVAVWGYRLIMRDVSGVPVVQAIDGPMRVAPDNPGGQIARHEGLAVNDVAGTGASTPPPDQLVLAPRPLDITDEDMPVAQVAEAAPQIETLNEQEALALASLRQDTETEAAALALSEIVNADDPIKALADQIAADATPLTDIEPAPNTGVFDQAPTEEVASVAPAPAIIPASVPGVSRSLRPAQRPAGLLQASLAAPVAASSGVADLDPSEIPSGTRLVQFGAYDSPQIAREQWDRLQARFGDFLVGKSRVVEEATSGGRVFYRLRAQGFEDLSDSRRFCAAIVAEGADCIPVVSR